METTINGIRLSYEEHGAGPVLLLLHAFPLSGAIWRHQVAALSASHRVIVPDLRGFGRSEAPQGPYLMEQYADDMAGLLGQIGVEQAVICGVSMGGYIAFAMLRRHSRLIRALILSDTRAGADSPEGRAGRETNARLAEEQGPGAIADKMIPNLIAPAAPQSLRDELRAIITANSPAGIAGALRGMALRPDSADLLPQIAVPTLIVVGNEDALTPPAEARAMHTAIAGSRLAEIPAAAHLPNLEQPEAFNEALGAFLKT